MTTTHKTFCKICSAYCGIEVDVADERIIAIRGDQSHPMSKGYTCTKGRQWAHQYHNDNRLLHAQSRPDRDQAFTQLENEQALDEISEKLQKIIDQHGPRAVAIYRGNGLSVSSNGNQVAQAWLAGLGSEMDFSSMTIDQPSKIIAISRHGVWGGGAHGFAGSDVCMLIGNNPLVSALNMTGGPPGWSPTSLKDEKKRGMKLIVIDPRLTETAEHADIHLAIRPGEDPSLLAGMIRLIIEEELFDKAFVETQTEGFEQLREAVSAFTLDYVSARTGLDIEEIAAAARLFATSTRGTASSGTGPDMAGFPHLSEHFILALNTLCGRWNREGEPVSAPNLLTPNIAPPAQTLPTDFLPPMLNPTLDTKTSRIRGIKQVFQEMPTPVAAEEILTPGEGQVKALIVIGGNPIMSWPSQDQTVTAMKALDLLVCIDIKHTATTRFADYLLPAAHAFERDGLAEFTDRLYDKPFGQYSRPLLKPQGNVLEEWRFLTGLAKRMGTQIQLPGGELDVHNSQLETLDILELMFPNEMVKVPIRELAKHEGGKLFEEFSDIKVSAPYEGLEAKLQLLPAEVIPDIKSVLAQPISIDGCYGDDNSYTHLLTVRRVKHVYNSSCHDFPKNPKGNPAYMHPDDLSELGFANGEQVELHSQSASILVKLAPDKTLRRGVISMAHCFGGDPSNAVYVDQFGGNASKLIAVDKDYDPLMGMPKFTAVPVKLKRSA